MVNPTSTGAPLGMETGSDAAREWAGLALAHPEFSSSVNPIPTKEENILPTRIWEPNDISGTT